MAQGWPPPFHNAAVWMGGWTLAFGQWIDGRSSEPPGCRYGQSCQPGVRMGAPFGSGLRGVGALEQGWHVGRDRRKWVRKRRKRHGTTFALSSLACRSVVPAAGHWMHRAVCVRAGEIRLREQRRGTKQWPLPHRREEHPPARRRPARLRPRRSPVGMPYPPRILSPV